MWNFQELWLSKHVLSVVDSMWYVEPSPIQEKVIPLFLQNNIDIVWQARTWSGKTAAFWLPLVDLLDKSTGKTRALIMAPTRELAVQVSGQLELYAKARGLNVAVVYGGQRMEKELAMIKKWIDILVATPWRIIDHVKRRKINLWDIEYFILDEFDEMLKMWFIDDVDYILSMCENRKRSLFFSATISKPIQNIITKYMPEYEHIHIKDTNNMVATIDQYYYNIKDSSKFDLLYRLILTNPEFYGIIFMKRKMDVDDLSQKLSEKGIQSQVIHGDILQNQREKALAKFKKWHNKILIATDVAARGIDIQDLSFVVNYDLPEGIQEYMHRIGRTGRAGKSGTAVTFVWKRDIGKFLRINEHVGKTIQLGKIPTKKDIMWSFIANLENQIKSFNGDRKSSEEYDLMIEDLSSKFESKDLLAYFMQDSFKVLDLDEEYIHNFAIDKNAKASSYGGDRWGYRGRSRWGDRWSSRSWSRLGYRGKSSRSNSSRSSSRDSWERKTYGRTPRKDDSGRSSRFDRSKSTWDRLKRSSDNRR